MAPLTEDDRGQAFALEGIIAAVIVASALILGIQAVDLEPLTSGDERANEQLRTQVSDALDVAEESGDRFEPVEEPNALRGAVTCVSREDGETVPNPAAVDPEGSTALGAIFAETLDNEYNYRIALEYPNETASNGVETAVLRDTALPSQPTVSVTRQIALYDSDIIRGNEDCQPLSGNPTLEEDLSIGFYVEDQHPDSELHAVVQIRVIAWS